MSALAAAQTLFDQPGVLAAGRPPLRPVARLAEPPASCVAGPEQIEGQTLAELIAGVWKTVSEHGLATCPVCGGEMRAGGGATEATEARSPGVARCASCGSELS